ncbi:hypothetical protein AURDEDRAFT_170383 [Auricularia subglabra TFB-10046 SS5]|nr:hypothetical protein AURDEDRAFT_170383 [Auricularia subglabra TFB-10046 SS5]
MGILFQLKQDGDRARKRLREEYQAITRAAKEKLIANRRTDFSEGPAPSEAAPSDKLSDDGTAISRVDDWEDDERAASPATWSDSVINENTDASSIGADAGVGGDESQHQDETQAYEEHYYYEVDDAVNQYYDDTYYYDEGNYYTDAVPSSEAVRNADAAHNTNAVHDTDTADADRNIDATRTAEANQEDDVDEDWIDDDGDIVDDDAGTVQDHDAEEEDEVDDSLVRPVADDDQDALADMPFYRISSMLSKVYDSTRVHGRNIPAAVERIRKARPNLSKLRERLPNLWKGTRSEGDFLKGIYHASPHCREERVLLKWIAIADDRKKFKKGEKKAKKNKWHDVGPHFGSACLKLEAVADWAPSWAFISLLPKDGSGQMYTWASESVMEERPELVEAMRRTMYAELRPLRKQAAAEREQERRELIDNHTSAEARLRLLEEKLAEAAATIAEQEEAEKELRKTALLWKARCMTESD